MATIVIWIFDNKRTALIKEQDSDCEFNLSGKWSCLTSSSGQPPSRVFEPHIFLLIELGNVFGDFTPNQAAAYVLASAFCWVFVMTLCKLVGYRKVTVNRVGVYFLFLGTSILSVSGYATRVPSVLNLWSNPLYMANMILIALAPIYLATVTWSVFAALVQYAGPQYSVIRPHAIVVSVFLLLIATLQLEIRGIPSPKGCRLSKVSSTPTTLLQTHRLSEQDSCSVVSVFNSFLDSSTLLFS